MVDSKLHCSPVSEYVVLMELLQKGHSIFPDVSGWEELILSEMDRCWWDMSDLERLLIEKDLKTERR